MKRRMKCGTCGTTKMTLADGRVLPLYVQLDNRVLSTTLERETECWDCGDKRRREEEEKKQNRLSRLIDAE